MMYLCSQSFLEISSLLSSRWCHICHNFHSPLFLSSQPRIVEELKKIVFVIFLHIYSLFSHVGVGVVGWACCSGLC